MKRRKTVNKYANLNDTTDKKQNTPSSSIYVGLPSLSKRLLSVLCSAAMINGIASGIGCEYRKEDDE